PGLHVGEAGVGQAPGLAVEVRLQHPVAAGRVRRRLGGGERGGEQQQGEVSDVARRHEAPLESVTVERYDRTAGRVECKGELPKTPRRPKGYTARRITDPCRSGSLADERAVG